MHSPLRSVRNLQSDPAHTFQKNQTSGLDGNGDFLLIVAGTNCLSSERTSPRAVHTHKSVNKGYLSRRKLEPFRQILSYMLKVHTCLLYIVRTRLDLRR